MPQTDGKRAPASDVDVVRRAYEALYVQKIEQLKNELSIKMKQKGFTSTLKSMESLNIGPLPTHNMSDVHGGVLEILPGGRIEAALDTNEGPVLLWNATRTDRQSPDPQLFPSSTRSSSDATADTDELTPGELLCQLTDSGTNPTCGLVCMVELARFNSSQNQTLLPLLWQYILHHRNSNDQSELIAVGAAIRKYIAIMPMDRMDELAVLLESGNKSPLPIDLEIEVAKMIYRNFEVFPPETADPQPELAQRLLEMAQAYTNPRILLRDKHAAAASLAIEAIVAMRSPLAEKALQAAIACPYRWFTELVSDDLDELQDRWIGKSEDAAGWLSELRSRLLTEK